MLLLLFVVFFPFMLKVGECLHLLLDGWSSSNSTTAAAAVDHGHDDERERCSVLVNFM